MKKTKTNNLRSLIRSQSLKPLIDHANKIENANKRLKHFLPSPLSEHVIVSNIKGNSLILQADSSAWATRTKFIATDVINYMRNEGRLAMIERLKVKVTPPKIVQNPSSSSVEPISDHTSELLKSVATGIDDKALSEVLLRLSQRAKKSD